MIKFRVFLVFVCLGVISYGLYPVLQSEHIRLGSKVMIIAGAVALAAITLLWNPYLKELQQLLESIQAIRRSALEAKHGTANAVRTMLYELDQLTKR